MERSMRHRWSWTACPSWLMAESASLSCELTEGVRGGFPAWRKKHERTILCAFIRSVAFEHVHVSLYNFFRHPYGTPSLHPYGKYVIVSPYPLVGGMGRRTLIGRKRLSKHEMF